MLEPERDEMDIAKGGPSTMDYQRPETVGGRSRGRVDENGMSEPNRGERASAPMRQPLGEGGLPCEISCVQGFIK